MTRRAVDADAIRGALRLRRALLAVLARAAASDDRDVLHRAGPDTWRLVLACECCALPLGARLRERGLVGELTEPARERLEAAELAELQRVLAARRTLDALDDVAARIGVEVVVLKGGALAAEADRPPLDLGDVDVLVHDELDAQRLWAALSAAGWRLASGAAMPHEPARADVNHLVAVRPAGAGLPLEIHTALDYDYDSPAPAAATPSRPLPGRRALRRLPGAAAAMLALRHSVVKHPHRRGHLRDLVLIAEALSTREGSESSDAPALDDDPHSPELSSMADQARAIRDGVASRDDGRTAAFVAWKYAFFARRAGVVGPFLPGWSALGFIALERAPLRRRALARQLRYAIVPPPATSPFSAATPAGGSVRSHAVRALRRAAGWPIRTAYRLGLLAILVVASPYIRNRIAGAMPD